MRDGMERDAVERVTEWNNLRREDNLIQFPCILKNFLRIIACMITNFV
jgi:hypothetical protein